MDLRDQIQELTAEYDNSVLFDDLPDKTQRRLTAAYIRQNPDIVHDSLAEIDSAALAEKLALLALAGPYDASGLIGLLAESVFPNQATASLIQADHDEREVRPL